MTLAFFVLIQYRSVTDRRTDRRTDGHLCSGYTSACIACYANALVKTLDSFTRSSFRLKQKPNMLVLLTQYAKYINHFSGQMHRGPPTEILGSQPPHTIRSAPYVSWCTGLSERNYSNRRWRVDRTATVRFLVTSIHSDLYTKLSKRFKF